jgi:hypothetical protein
VDIIDCMTETGFWLGITFELKKVKRDISSSSSSSSSSSRSSSSCSSRTFVLSPRLLNRFRTPVAETGSVCPVCSNASRIFDVIVCILYVTMHFVLHHIWTMFTARPVSVEGQQNDYVRRNFLPRGGKLGIADRYRYSI